MIKIVNLSIQVNGLQIKSILFDLSGTFANLKIQ